jgi:hypothetical protein
MQMQASGARGIQTCYFEASRGAGLDCGSNSLHAPLQAQHRVQSNCVQRAAGVRLFVLWGVNVEVLAGVLAYSAACASHRRLQRHVS